MWAGPGSARRSVDAGSFRWPVVTGDGLLECGLGASCGVFWPLVRR